MVAVAVVVVVVAVAIVATEALATSLRLIIRAGPKGAVAVAM